MALPAIAQLPLEADTTLGSEASVVTPAGASRSDIEGGATRGRNLFHSFREFNIEAGDRVYFANPAGIETIFSRVTGENESTLLGTLGVLGEADLFLLNPNGIFFGENARLDIRGSFVATTADALQFGDVGTFSARNPTAPSPLLTIDPSAFLFGQVPPGLIEVRSTAPSAQGETLGLRVPDGDRLLLLGGDVVNDGGMLTAPGGQIILAAVAGEGRVAFDEVSLTLPAEILRGDVVLRDGAIADVTAAGGGTIRLFAHTIELANSGLYAGIGEGLGNPTRQAGNIELDASDRIRLTRTSQIFNNVLAGGTGTSGNIRISAQDLQILEGSQISASTFGTGNSGQVRLVAGDRILLAGIRPDGLSSSAAFSNVGSGAVGNGGDVILVAPIIELRDGAQLSASTLGRGNAGRIRLVAGDRLTLSGISPTAQFASAALSRVEAGAVGNGGGIRFTAAVIEVRDGAQVSAATLGQGNAGTVQMRAGDRLTFAGTSADGRFRSAAFSTVGSQARGSGGDLRFTTPVLEFLDGTGFSASTFGQGDAGDVRMRVGDRLTLAGTSADGRFSSVGFSRVEENAVGSGGTLFITTQQLELRDGAGLTASTRGRGSAGDMRIRVGDRLTLSGNLPDDPEVRSGIFSQVEEGAIGNGGNLNIQAPTLEISGGVLSARSEGTGTGGNITVTTDILRLLDRAEVSTETFSTDGGNIRLTVGELLTLRTNSLISTAAGTTQSGGDGGDITLDNPNGFITAIPQEDSDIVANAFEGRGGNIRITTQGIFGLEFRDARTPLSDITASSEIGVDGEVEIITPNTDPTQGLVALPTDVVNVADQIGQVCPTGPGAAGRLGRFVVTGRGGITTSPLEVLDHPTIAVDWLEDSAAVPATERISPPEAQSPVAWVEANGWQRSEDGRVHLVAIIPNRPQNPRHALLPCYE